MLPTLRGVGNTIRRLGSRQKLLLDPMTKWVRSRKRAVDCAFDRVDTSLVIITLMNRGRVPWILTFWKFAYPHFRRYCMSGSPYPRRQDGDPHLTFEDALKARESAGRQLWNYHISQLEGTTTKMTMTQNRQTVLITLVVHEIRLTISNARQVQESLLGARERWVPPEGWPPSSRHLRFKLRFRTPMAAWTVLGPQCTYADQHRN